MFTFKQGTLTNMHHPPLGYTECWPFWLLLALFYFRQKKTKKHFFRKKRIWLANKKFGLFFYFNLNIAKKSTSSVKCQVILKRQRAIGNKWLANRINWPFFFQSWTQKMFFFCQLAKTFGHFWMARFGHFFFRPTFGIPYSRVDFFLTKSRPLNFTAN